MKLNKPAGYDEAQAASEFKVIEPGNYAAVICKVSEGVTPNGSEYIEFWIDIIDGEFTRYYEKDYKSQTVGEKKWRGTVRFFTSERALPMLKAAITAIEESNPGYKFDWDDTTVKGKKVGVSIRREQYEATDGTLKFTTRPFAFRDIKKVISGELEVPKDKLLKTQQSVPQTSASPYPTASYAPANNTPPGYTTPAPTAAPSYPPLTEVGPEDELPF